MDVTQEGEGSHCHGLESLSVRRQGVRLDPHSGAVPLASVATIYELSAE